MPFMIGKAPIRRTLQYLNAGALYLKESIQIFSINYNTTGDHHEGARDLVFWKLPQIQYKNPKVQCITFKNMTPSPFITCYYENGKSMLIDIDGRSQEQIMKHLHKVIGKSKHALLEKEEKEAILSNPANFGVGCKRHCICTIIGQVPCSGVVPLPNHMRGKFKNSRK